MDGMTDEARESNADEEAQTKAETDPNPRAAAEELDHGKVMKRWDRAFVKDRNNINLAYDDLAFLAGNQWPDDLRLSREQDSRPVLTFNRLGQFVRQVTGDMRQMRPAIKVVPCDDGADEKIADIRSGLIRYIENRCDASRIYTAGADSQVACGMGHWEVFGEYADDSTFEQELGVRLVDDQVSILWDPDAKHPTRRDAIYCFCPVDLTQEAYKEAYPGYAIGDIGTNANFTSYYADWYNGEHVRVARYWYKIKIKRKLMLMPGGGYEDLEGLEPGDVERMKSEGGKEVERDGHKIKWVMMNATEFLTEPKEWPGRYIPMIPVIGEEIRVGSNIQRHGIVRFAADPQRAYNYARSTQTEFVGLQPKSPFVGTEENFKDYESEWNTANVKNWPFLRYKPDPRNGNAAPQRQMPPQSGSGLTECVVMAEQDMQAVIGIYNASLGAKSNETSGIAIQKRQTEGDTGTFIYMDNFALSITHTARVLNDLIPHYYDTKRTIRVLAADGTERRVPINAPNPIAIEGVPIEIVNDMTNGAYDIQMEMGPSYQTKREQARDGMTAFIQAFPPAGPVIGDLIAKAQDWPNADDVAERLQTLLPPQIQAQIAQKNNQPPPPPAPPSPQAQAEGAKAQAEIAKSKGEEIRAQAEGVKAQAAILHGQLEAQMLQLKLKHQELLNVKAEFDVIASQQALGPPMDVKALQTQLAEMDMALQMLGVHAATQVGGPTPAPAPAVSTTPQETSTSGDGEGNGGQGGGDGGSAPETPPPLPPLPPNHYASVPSAGAE